MHFQPMQMPILSRSFALLRSLDLSVPRRPQATLSAVLWSLGQADPVRRPLPLTQSPLILKFTADWAAAAARAS